MISPEYVADNYYYRLPMDRTALNSAHKVAGQRKRLEETQLDKLHNWFICAAHHYSRYPLQLRDVEITACGTALALSKASPHERRKMHSCVADCKNGKIEGLGSSEFRVNFCPIFRPVTSG